MTIVLTCMNSCCTVMIKCLRILTIMNVFVLIINVCIYLREFIISPTVTVIEIFLFYFNKFTWVNRPRIHGDDCSRCIVLVETTWCGRGRQTILQVVGGDVRCLDVTVCTDSEIWRLFWSAPPYRQLAGAWRKL